MKLLGALHPIWTAAFLGWFGAGAWQHGEHGTVVLFLMGLVFFLSCSAIANEKKP